MYIFKIHGKEYKVRFTYRQLCNDDLLDRVTNAINDDTERTPKSLFAHIANTCAELLLAGLQKYHEKEFGYKTDETKQERIDQLIDWFDDYEDESTEDHPQSAATLYSDLQDELGKNGFLSAIMGMTQRAEEAEQIAETVKTEMEQKTVMEKVTNFPTAPTESES